MRPQAPIDFLTAEPDEISGEEACAALLRILEQVAEQLLDQAADAHVLRCAGCGSWAWDERPCSTCAVASQRRRHARFRAA